MALKLLIVDPDDEWLSSAADFLKQALYEVTTVNNGKDAQLSLYNDKFFGVILNWDVQNHSGSQVLKFIRSNYPAQRVVVVLDVATSADEEKVRKLGATEVAKKPFELNHLADLLEGHQSLGDLMGSLPRKKGQSDEVEISVGDNEFTQVGIDDFYSAQAVLFDVFVKLASGRYVKILHAGDTFSKERIDKYKNEKKVEFLYFKTTDRRKFIQYHNHLAKKLINTDNIPGQSKMGLMQVVAEKFVEEVYTQGMKPQVIDQGKEVAENIFNLVEKSKDLHKVLKELQNFDPNAYTHSFLTSIFTTAIIKQFEWQSKVTIETTALACLFHDIGKLKLPKGLADKDPKDMSESEFEEYKKHPEYGVEIVDGNRMISNSVKQIIMQHHEYYNGTGFPFQKRGSKILTLANIVCLANDFVNMMTREKLSPTDTLKKMLSDQEIVSRYNSMIVENFIKVFVDPQKLFKDKAA